MVNGVEIPYAQRCRNTVCLTVSKYYMFNGVGTLEKQVN